MKRLRGPTSAAGAASTGDILRQAILTLTARRLQSVVGALAVMVGVWFLVVVAPLCQHARSAAAALDPEVSAKAKRRRFRRSTSCQSSSRRTPAGHRVRWGRLLRREALYSSHLSTRRKAVREASLEVLARKAPTEALGGQGGREEGAQARARERAPGRGAPQGAPHHRGPRKSIGAAGSEPRRREVLLTAAEELAGQVGVSAARYSVRYAGRTGDRDSGRAPHPQELPQEGVRFSALTLHSDSEGTPRLAARGRSGCPADDGWERKRTRGRGVVVQEAGLRA